MKIGLIYFSGLFTNPNGDLCGARPHLVALRQLLEGLGHDVFFTVQPWNGVVTPYILGRCVVGGLLADDPYRGRADLEAPLDFNIVAGHSHGARAAKEAVEGLPSGVAVDVAALIDDCPPLDLTAHVASRINPLMPPVGARRGCAFWQTNDEPSGCSYQNRKGWINTDVSKWIPRVGHINNTINGNVSIASQDGVWNMIQAVAFNALACKQAGAY